VALLSWLLTMPVQVFGFGLPEPVWPWGWPFAWALIRPSMFAPMVLAGAGAVSWTAVGRADGSVAAQACCCLRGAWRCAPLMAGRAMRHLGLVRRHRRVALGAAYLFTTSTRGPAAHMGRPVAGAGYGFVVSFGRSMTEQFEDVDTRFR
jgi:rod shape-determining protein MreD